MKLIMKFHILKGGIPILDQSLEFPFKAQKPPHEEEVYANSHEEEVQLDDAVEIIGRLNLEENEAPLVDRPGPSWKVLKWVTKTLESIHLDEVRNMETRSSTR